MELKLLIFGKVYSICIGYKTPWFGQIYFITVIREWYDGIEVSDAKMIFRIYKRNVK